MHPSLLRAFQQYKEDNQGLPRFGNLKVTNKTNKQTHLRYGYSNDAQ